MSYFHFTKTRPVAPWEEVTPQDFYWKHGDVFADTSPRIYATEIPHSCCNGRAIAWMRENTEPETYLRGLCEQLADAIDKSCFRRAMSILNQMDGCVDFGGIDAKCAKRDIEKLYGAINKERPEAKRILIDSQMYVLLSNVPKQNAG